MTVPKLRFPEFSDDWTVYKLSDFTKRVTRKNSNNESDLPLTISSLDGLISQSSFFDRQIASKDMSGYFLLKHGEFAYNKSYSKGFEFGSIKRLDKYPMGTLSTLYICFHLIQNDSDFMKYYFDSLKWYEQVYRISAEGARNHGLLNVSPHDFFSTKHVLPVLPEQKKIADFLSSFDKRIETTQKKLTTLEKLKKGFMQKIFSQRLRFKDDNGNDYPAWKEREIKDIAPLQRGFDLPTQKLHNGNYPVVYSNGIGAFHSQYKCVGEAVITGRSGTIGKVIYLPNCKYWPHNTTLWVTDFCNNYPKFVYYLFTQIDLSRFSSGSGVPTLNRNDIHSFKVCIPSLPEQKKIADFLSAFDEKMNLVRKEVDTLQTIKKGLLQQMFV